MIKDAVTMSYDRSLVYYHEALDLYCGNICAPRMAIIYPVYGCNFSCKGCLCSHFNIHKQLYMDLEKFKVLSTQLKEQGVQSIEFCGGGEPLLHPDIKKMILWVTDHLHMSLGIMTNGSMLNDHLDHLLATRASYVRVSVYDYHHEQMMKKVYRLIEIKEATDGDCVIGVKFLADEDNRDRILSWVREVADNPGVNRVSVKAKRGEHEIRDYTALEKEINALQHEKITANLAKSYLKGRCWMSPIHTLIDPHGDVYICCYYMGREAEHCIGNTFEKPFGEIWGSTEHREKLRRIDTKKCNVFDCRWHKYNETMMELLGHNTHHQFC